MHPGAHRRCLKPAVITRFTDGSAALQLTDLAFFPETLRRRFLPGLPRCPQAASWSPFLEGMVPCSGAGRAGRAPRGPLFSPGTVGTG